MHHIVRKFTRNARTWATALAVVGTAAMASIPTARADEAQAKRLLKAMSDYLASQKSISMDIDSNLEIVTRDGQKLALASSGTLTLNRPDKLRATRKGGFADIELVFDGKTATLLGKNANVYAQVEVPGTIDHFIDELRDKYERPVPAADLLMSNPYDEVMPMVVNTKDLGSGVIRGIECDHLAFRTEEVDWQIWIAQGAPSLSVSPFHHHQQDGWSRRNIPSMSGRGKQAPRSRPITSAPRFPRAPGSSIQATSPTLMNCPAISRSSGNRGAL